MKHEFLQERGTSLKRSGSSLDPFHKTPSPKDPFIRRLEKAVAVSGNLLL